MNALELSRGGMAMLRPVRTLQDVLLDHINTDQDRAQLDKRAIVRELTDDEDRRMAALDEQIAGLEDEAKRLIRAATGVSWDSLYRVLA